jgi:hypothetical protein
MAWHHEMLRNNRHVSSIDVFTSKSSLLHPLRLDGTYQGVHLSPPPDMKRDVCVPAPHSLLIANILLDYMSI